MAQSAVTAPARPKLVVPGSAALAPNVERYRIQGVALQSSHWRRAISSRSLC